MLEIDNLSAWYGIDATDSIHRNDGTNAPVLHGVSLTLAPGEFVCVVGSNGAGKTALLRAISRELTTRGRIAIDATDLAPLSPPDVVKLGILQCPEGRKLFADMSVRDNLLLGAYCRSNAREIQDDLKRVFALFPVLNDRARQRAGALSGGEQQMLAVARALMGRPKVLLLDEPSFGIAPIVFERIIRVLNALTEKGLSILLTEQNARLALDIADRAYVLELGRIVLSGPSSVIAANPSVRTAYLGL